MILFAPRYGNLEMSDLSALAIALTGVVSTVFFVVAFLDMNTKALIDSSVEKFDDDWFAEIALERLTMACNSTVKP